jgi:type VI secretion system protein ImpG
LDDRFLQYYERELTFIREMGAEFARRYPKIAGRLLIEPDKCEDPHTERLIEAFAFISGRIHKKVDDDFPEITESLLNVIYPHYVNPIPSMAVVKFEPIAKNIPETGYDIANATTIYSKPVRGAPCRFITCQPVTLWPVDVVSAQLRDPKDLVSGAQQAILIEIKRLAKIDFAQLTWSKLRFFLNGPSQHIFHLYELIFNQVCGVVLECVDDRGASHAIPLPADTIKPVGFDPEEAILPCPQRSFTGYQLLTEYFSFPEKFLFFDLCGLEKMRGSAFTDKLQIWIYLDRVAEPTLVVNQDTFCLHAAPAVNLFRRIAEPIRVENRKTEYPVIPDLRRQFATEIYSIDRVKATSPASPDKSIEFRPFYSIRHHLESDEGTDRRVFWHAQRRVSPRKGDSGTEMFISFTDLDFNPADPGVEVVTVHTTCTNRDLPARLPFGDPDGDFDLEIEGPVAKIISIIKPTPTRRPYLGGELQWRLISHLSLNYLSLVEGGEEALKEILKLYDFDNSPSTHQQIAGIVSLQTEHVTKRVGQSFCRGVRVTLLFDEDKFIGSGLYLFASVLERFLAQYVSVNSFSQLVAKTLQRKEVLKSWLPRNGNQILL